MSSMIVSPTFQKLLGKLKTQVSTENPAAKSVARQRLDAILGEASVTTYVLARVAPLRLIVLSQTSTRSPMQTRRRWSRGAIRPSFNLFVAV